MALHKIFKIYGSELGKVLQFAGLGAVLQAGLIIGISGGDSLFLSNVGVSSLPYIYMVMPVIMLLYASLFSYLISKWGIQRLLLNTLSFVALITFLLFLLIGNRDSLTELQLTVLYYGIKIFTTVIYIAFYSLFWNFTDLYFDMLESKRVYSFFAGGSAFGVMVGGFLTTFSAELVGVHYLFLIWSLSGLASILVLHLIIRNNIEIDTLSESDQKEEPVLQLIKRHGSTILKNRYVMSLAGMVFLVALLAGITEYQYYEIFSLQFSETELVAELGRLYAFVNIFNIIVCLFLFNRLVLRIGVTNVALIQPVVYILAFSFLLLHNGYETAVFAFIAYQGFSVSVDNNNYNLLYNALPIENRAQLRTILEGLLEPVAIAVSGVFLIFYAQNIPPEGISLVGFCAALLLFVVVLLANRDYMGSIVQNLKTQWLDFSRRFTDLVTGLSDKELRFVESKCGGHRDEAILAVRVLKSNEVPSALTTALSLASQWAVQNQPVDPRLKDEIKQLMNSKDHEVMVQLLTWYESQHDFRNSEIIELLAANRFIHASKVKHLLQEPVPNIRGIALTAMLVSWDIKEIEQALRIIDGQLDGERAEILTAIRVLGYSRDRRFIQDLLPLLCHTDNELRTTTLQSLKEIADRDSHTLINPILEVTESGTTRERMLCFEILEKIGDSDCLIPLIKMSPHFTPYELRRVSEIISGMGPLILPILVAVFRDAHMPDKARALAANVMYDVAPAQFERIFEEIIVEEIHTAYKFLYNYHLLDSSSINSGPADLLRRFYFDTPINKINFILEILTTVGRLPAYELIANSLRSSNSKMRSYALEAVEQGVSREIFRILVPLVDGRPLTETLALIDEIGLSIPESMEELFENGLHTDYSIEKAALLSALWEQKAPSAPSHLRNALRQTDDLLVHETVLSLLDTTEGGTPECAIYNMIKMVNAASFDEHNILEIKYLAERCTLFRFQKNETIYQQQSLADYLFLHVDGYVTEKDETGSGKIVEIGTLFGDEVIRGEEYRRSNVMSGHCELLGFHKQLVENCAGLFPEFTINLLLRGMS